MADEKQTPEVEVQQRSMLGAFIRHQVNAAEETGKALISLLPKDFRTHSRKAAAEGKAGVDVLVDGMLGGVEHGLKKARSRIKPDSADASKSKIKVEVE